MGGERDPLEGRESVCPVGLDEGDRGPENKVRNVRSWASLGAWDSLCLPLGAGDSSGFPSDVTTPASSTGMSLTHQGLGCLCVGWSIRTGGKGGTAASHGPWGDPGTDVSRGSGVSRGHCQLGVPGREGGAGLPFSKAVNPTAGRTACFKLLLRSAAFSCHLPVPLGKRKRKPKAVAGLRPRRGLQ